MKKSIFHYILSIFFIVVNIYFLLKIFAIRTSDYFLSQVTSINYYYSLLIIGFFFVTMGFLCYLKKTNSIVMRTFLYLMYSLGFAITLSLPSGLEISPGREIEMIAASSSPYFLMLFFEYFPASSKPKWFKKTRSMILLISIAINFIFFSSYFVHLNHHQAIIEIVRTTVITNIFLSLIACIVLTYLHLKSNSNKVKNQLSVLIGSLVLSFLPVLFFSLIPEIFFQTPGIPFYYSSISISFFPIALAYLLTKQEIIDIKIRLKVLLFEAVTFIFTFFIVNAIFSLFFKLDRTIAFQISILVIVLLLAYHLAQKIFSPLMIRKWTDKAQNIQKEKMTILQKMLQGQHLNSCARLIIRLIHETIDINGTCLIWRVKRIPRMLHQTGIFESADLANRLIHLLNNRKYEQLKEEKLHVFSLGNSDYQRGWIVIGQKTNGTKLEKSELLLLEKIQSDALELLTSTEALSQIGRKLRKSQSRFLSQEQFNRALLDDREEEKRKLSIFLHDEVLQNIILLANKVDALHTEKMIDNKAYLEMKELLMNNIYEIREMSRELHPFMVEDLGLEQSLQALKRKLQNNYNVIIRTTFHLKLKMISKKLSVQVYRIIKELLHNAVKHSSSPVILLSLTDSVHFLTIHVEDQGKGFELPGSLSGMTKDNHLGLMTVQKRVNQLDGVFDIQSERGRGTSITITLPLERSDNHEYQRLVSR
ncbi:histidine kinase [Sporolactobacillus sp. THM7-7]|nr:histidine kinase [Sporolactobacillus sp. THM7-7]